MTRPLRVGVVVAGLFVLHFLLHIGLGFGPEAPDLLTVALLLVAREVHMGGAAGIGLAFGIVEDSLSVLSFGANTISMTLLGGLGALTRDLFVGDSLVFLVSYFTLGKWMRDFLHWVTVGETLRQPFVDQVLVQGVVASVYAAAVGVLVMTVSGLWKESPLA